MSSRNPLTTSSSQSSHTKITSKFAKYSTKPKEDEEKQMSKYDQFKSLNDQMEKLLSRNIVVEGYQSGTQANAPAPEAENESQPNAPELDDEDSRPEGQPPRYNKK